MNYEKKHKEAKQKFEDALEILKDSFINEACDWWWDNFVYTDDIEDKCKVIREFSDYMREKL